MKLGFIGTGNQATAILKGIRRTQTIAMRDIYAYDIDAERCKQTAMDLGFAVCDSAQELVVTCDTVVLAVKPQQLAALLGELSPVIRKERPFLISMAAGTPIAKLEAYLNAEVPYAIGRIMPNQNAAVAQSMTAYCYNEKTDAKQAALLQQFVQSFGEAIALEESFFSAFVVLAGSAPAFVFLMIDQLARAGVKIGMPRPLAQQIATQTVLGSAQLLQEGRTHPQELIDRVCSPGGTTIAGITKLEEYGFPNAVMQAVEAAYKRDLEMQKSE